MKKETIMKSIDIKASADKVWKVLFLDVYNTQWLSEFMEGTHAQTDWKEGSKIIFSDTSNEGLVGKIVTSTPNEIMSIQYDGAIVNGKEEYDTERAKEIKGFKEIYRLTPAADGTHLLIESDMNEQDFEYMSKAWDKALLTIKKLAET